MAQLRAARRSYFGKIGSLTYIAECSAMKNRGVNEAFTEAARVALTVKNVKGDKDSSSCSVM